MFAQHVEALLTILIGKRNAGAFQRFSLAIARPGPAQVSAPCPDCSSVFDGRRFLQAMASSDVYGVAVAVPDELDGGKGVIPAEIHSANARPVRREVTVFADNLGFLDREYSAGAENRNPFRASFQLVFGIRRYNPLFFFSRVMLNVIDRHRGYVTIF